MIQFQIEIISHPKPSDVSRKQHCCQKCHLPKFGHTKEKCQAQLRPQAQQQQITPVPPPAAIIGGSRPELMNGQPRICEVTTTPRSNNFDGARYDEGPGQPQVQRSAAPLSFNNLSSLYGKDDEQIIKELADLDWKGNMLEVLEWATGTRV
ncbi:hypothetical protein M422DRAFT_71975 [Sphaerobolus stellatus SS14]|uniref:Uncharacterized protein n=1 Tax=Sphaerobolus stellatus (strain SS14) TaxID=990650 RepID=A0A0C9UKY5_SPHS4|nr:hypothetical protein M422DRAFT_71975 [Sphaerobolus stellatus SS14]